MLSDKQPPLFVPDFVLIPYQLLCDRELEQIDRFLYGLIYWFEHLKDGECRASNHTFAALLFTTTRVVQNSLNNLEKAGYIEREYKDEARRNRLTIHCKIAFKYLSPIGDRRKTSVPQVTRERPIGDRHERPIGDQSIERGRKNISKKNPARTAQEEKEIADVIEAFKDVNPSYKLLFPRVPQREAAWRLLQQFQLGPLLRTVSFLRHSNATRYAPTVTTPVQLESKLGELKAWAEKQRAASGGKGKKIISSITA